MSKGRKPQNKVERFQPPPEIKPEAQDIAEIPFMVKSKALVPILIGCGAFVLTVYGFILKANQNYDSIIPVIHSFDLKLDKEINLRKIFYTQKFVIEKDSSSSNPYKDSILYYDLRQDTFLYKFLNK
jgi:hypothetical protein